MPQTIDEQAWLQSHCWPVRVYFEDTDAGGIVFYANYLKFMERARTEWLRSFGVQQQAIASELGVGFVVSELDMKYRQPARLDDLLTVQTLITQAGRASLNFAQRVIRSEAVLALGNIRVGCVDLKALRPTALPDIVLKQITLLEKDKR
jgi:acyl-CoA thioester hydrolase